MDVKTPTVTFNLLFQCLHKKDLSLFLRKFIVILFMSLLFFVVAIVTCMFFFIPKFKE